MYFTLFCLWTYLVGILLLEGLFPWLSAQAAQPPIWIVSTHLSGSLHVESYQHPRHSPSAHVEIPHPCWYKKKLPHQDVVHNNQLSTRTFLKLIFLPYIMQRLDFIGTSKEQNILSSEHIRSMQCLGEQEISFNLFSRNWKTQIILNYTSNALLKLIIISYLVGVDQVDVSGSVYDEVDLRTQIRVVLFSHPHVYESNIPLK